MKDDGRPKPLSYLERLSQHSLMYELALMRALLPTRFEAEAAYAEAFNEALSDRDRAAAIVLREWKPDPDTPVH